MEGGRDGIVYICADKIAPRGSLPFLPPYTSESRGIAGRRVIEQKKSKKKKTRKKGEFLSVPLSIAQGLGFARNDFSV